MRLLVVPGAFTAPGSYSALWDRLATHPRLTRATDLSNREMSGVTGRVVDPRRVTRLRWPQQLRVDGLRGLERSLAEHVCDGQRDDTDGDTDGDTGEVVLVGHSMGALLALRVASLAAEQGRRLGGLVLLMPVPPTGLGADVMHLLRCDPGSALRLAGLAVSVAPVRRWPLTPPRGLYSPDASAAELTDARQRRRSESWLTLAQVFLVGHCGRRHGGPADLGCLTLVVSGSGDTLVRPATAASLARTLAATYREVPVAHAFHEEAVGVALVADVVAETVCAWRGTTRVPRAPT